MEVHKNPSGGSCSVPCNGTDMLKLTVATGDVLQMHLHSITMFYIIIDTTLQSLDTE
jgi:hypothetical protein